MIGFFGLLETSCLLKEKGKDRGLTQSRKIREWTIG
jgi:hypothetical protein